MKPKSEIFKNLFVFEMANNHCGKVKHGLKIIRDVYDACKGFDFNFGFKLQYRDLDTFIHPDFKDRHDLKYIERFSKTRLSEKEFRALKDEIEKLGFISVCTPFDEKSVALIEKQNFDVIKVGSCSVTDWPLLERIVESDKPVIISTAGILLEELDKVFSFFSHRKKVFALMHCVAEYPTPDEALQLNQIDLLRSRYPGTAVGYSTHERPDNFVSVKLAIAKKAAIFEKHVGIKTDDISLNAYSATPQQVRLWLEAAREAFKLCGVSGKRREFSEKELSALKDLRRGVFAKKLIRKGEALGSSNTFLAIPAAKGQITANDMSKYTEFYCRKDIAADGSVLLSNLKRVDNREKIYTIVQKVKSFLKQSGVLVPGELNLEISHHYGVNKFQEYGCVLINFVNREYCKKLIVMLPGQKHPQQYHKLKEETFQVLYGDVSLDLNGQEDSYKSGDIVTIKRNTRHAFSSVKGAVIEEISSTHRGGDSYYTDKEIAKNTHRKTLITYWLV